MSCAGDISLNCVDLCTRTDRRKCTPESVHLALSDGYGGRRDRIDEQHVPENSRQIQRPERVRFREFYALFSSFYPLFKVTAGNIRFLLLHEGRNEELVRTFFQEVYEAYVKVRAFLLVSTQLCFCASQLLMNPFYTYDTPICSSSFDQRIQAIARRFL